MVRAYRYRPASAQAVKKVGFQALVIPLSGVWVVCLAAPSRRKFHPARTVDKKVMGTFFSWGISFLLALQGDDFRRILGGTIVRRPATTKPTLFTPFTRWRTFIYNIGLQGRNFESRVIRRLVNGSR